VGAQRLFDRDTHRVTLTPAGSALLPIARDVLDQFSSIPWRLREATRAQRSTVLVGTPSGLDPELRTRVGTLTDRVRERFELQRRPVRTQALWLVPARADVRSRRPGCRKATRLGRRWA
jgi:DNA-binding transcriptional LysR family regulator